MIVVKRYDSLSQFLDVCESHSQHQADIAYDRFANTANNAWFGDQSRNQAVRIARTGDNKLAHKAEALLDKLADIDNGESILEWGHSPVGAYPVVPEFIAGRPDCMRAQLPGNEHAPVNIYVSVAVRSTTAMSFIRDKGIAILALVMKLQKTRPVNLYVTYEAAGLTNSYLQVVPIESRPLSIAHAANCLTSPAFLRRLMFLEASINCGFQGRREQSDMRKNYELGPDDLFIEGSQLQETLDFQPIEWVNERLARYNAVEV